MAHDIIIILDRKRNLTKALADGVPELLTIGNIIEEWSVSQKADILSKLDILSDLITDFQADYEGQLAVIQGMCES